MFSSNNFTKSGSSSRVTPSKSSKFQRKAYFPLVDFAKLAGEKIRREQVGTVPTFLSVRENKFAKWKTGLTFKMMFVLNIERNIHDVQPNNGRNTVCPQTVNPFAHCSLVKL